MVNNRLCGVPKREVFESVGCSLDYYPEINLNCDIFNSSAANLSSRSFAWRNVIVPVNESILKRITRTFFETGFAEALNEARSAEAPVISPLAEYIFTIVGVYKEWMLKIFPHTKEHDACSIAKFSETREWMRSHVRCIAWHPNSFKIAVAGSDDYVRIYTDEPAVMPILKSGDQKWITAMAWRPYSAVELAVGCEKGLCLWTLDSNMNITRNSSQAVVFKQSNHSPVTSVQWNVDGTLLATASIGDTDVVVWNVDKNQRTPLKRVGPPCSILKWSPNGSYLFSATVDNVFRVWSTEQKWTPERWTINEGNIQSACWSPCSNFLLFVTSTDFLLYQLQFSEELLFQNEYIMKQASPIADLSKCNVNEHGVGGSPQSIAWDPNGFYLAVIYKNSSCITIFTTCIKKYDLTISPLFFLCGHGNEYPSYICFQSKNRKNTESVLTIGWSSGRIQYFPFSNM